METNTPVSLSDIDSSLNIIFITKNYDMNRASYRIWVHYLSGSLQTLGVKAKVCTIGDECFSDANVIIFDKGIPKETIQNIRKKLKEDTLVGAINPPADSQLPVHFAIAGSREEESTFSHYPNVVVVPLIEPPIHALPLKEHRDNETIRLSYHGNDLHLSSFQSSGLKNALERFKKELNAVNRNLILKVISAENPKWLVGKPKVDIEYVKYDWDTFPQSIANVDIGLVPNCYFKKANGMTAIFYKKVLNVEWDKTDIIMRMKNKSNFGRLLTLMEAGIPAVADLTPSNLQLIGDPLNGFCVSNEEGWLRAFRVLSLAAERNEMAKNAKSFAMSQFDPLNWAKRFYESMLKLHAGKNKYSVHSTNQLSGKQEAVSI